jgi:hypothetical protein
MNFILEDTMKADGFTKTEYKTENVRVYYKQHTYNGKPCWKGYIFSGRGAKPKNKYNIFLKAEDYIKTVKSILNAIRYKKELKEKQKQEANEFAATVKVGDIFVNSWGYDQTNVTSRQVVEKKGMTIKLKEIYNETMKAESSMSSMVKPVKDSFKENEEVITKRITGSYINGIGSRWDGKEDYYCSWYA